MEAARLLRSSADRGKKTKWPRRLNPGYSQFDSSFRIAVHLKALRGQSPAGSSAA
jgi:hypothetical protein